MMPVPVECEWAWSQNPCGKIAGPVPVITDRRFSLEGDHFAGSGRIQVMNMKRAFEDDRRMDYCGYREDDQMEVGNNY